MITPNDDTPCDVQFSIRVPQNLADEIFKRSTSLGIKPSAWIRKAISGYIASTGRTEKETTRQNLLTLLRQDSEIRKAIREITTEDDKRLDNCFKGLNSKFESLRTLKTCQFQEVTAKYCTLQNRLDCETDTLNDINNKIYFYEQSLRSKESLTPDAAAKYPAELKKIKEKRTCQTEIIAALKREIGQLDLQRISLTQEIDVLSGKIEKEQLEKEIRNIAAHEERCAPFDKDRINRDRLRRHMQFYRAQNFDDEFDEDIEDSVIKSYLEKMKKE